MSLTAFTLAWLGASTSYVPPDSQREEPAAASTVDAVVERIIDVESGGDPNAKSKRSSATGLGQFLDETINRLATLASCRESQSWTDLARHAHSLKSTAQSFGLPETGQQARLLQIAADNLDIAGIDVILPQLIRITDEECREFAVMRQELNSAPSQ